MRIAKDYSIARLVVPLLVGLGVAVAINCKVINYVMPLLCLIGVFAAPVWIIELLIARARDRSQLVRVFALQCLVFFVVAGIGLGTFYTTLRKQVADLDNRRAEVAYALASGNPELPGICFRPDHRDGSIDTDLCWSQDVIVYYHQQDYRIVIPVTRPLLISSTSFRVLTWQPDCGWNLDRFHWYMVSMAASRT